MPVVHYIAGRTSPLGADVRRFTRPSAAPELGGAERRQWDSRALIWWEHDGRRRGDIISTA